MVPAPIAGRQCMASAAERRWHCTMSEVIADSSSPFPSATSGRDDRSRGCRDLVRPLPASSAETPSARRP